MKDTVRYIYYIVLILAIGIGATYSGRHIDRKFLGIENLRFHDLRHEACTRLAEQGFTIPQLQQVSLHESWKCLQIYVSAKKRKDVLQIDDVLHLIGEM